MVIKNRSKTNLATNFTNEHELKGNIEKVAAGMDGVKRSSRK